MSNHDGLGSIADLRNELERRVQERTVEPAELYEALQVEIAERKRAETLLAGQNRVLEMIAKGAPLADVLNVLARFVEEQSQQILCSILLIDRDGLHLRHSAAPSLPESYNRAIDGVAIGQGVGSWGTAAFLEQPIIVSDIATDPLWQDYRELALKHELRAYWSTPIFSATNQVLGTFIMYYREVRRPTRRELHLIEIALHLAGIAIARQWTEEELRQHMARAEALAKISQKLVEAGLDSKMALDTIAQHTAEAIGDGCVIALLSSDGLQLKPVAFHHPNSEAKALISQVLGFPSQPVKHDLIAIQTGQPVLIPTILREEMRQMFQPEYWPYLEQVGIHSMLIVPMRVKDQIIGTLGVTRDAPGRPYDADDQAFLLNLADRAALTITNAQLFEQVHDARQRLQALSHRLLEVQEIERRHIARELHDEIGQILTALTLILDMSSRLSTKAVRTSLNEAQTLVNELMERVDELALNLRPAMLDDLGLLPALLWHFERYTRQTRVQVTFKHRRLEGRRFAPGVETAAYRIVQEALTNVARHAEVSQVTVRLWADSDTLDVQIEDQGVGFDPQAVLAAGDSIGLSGMQKRAALLGGQLRIESAPGAGVCLTAELPLQGSA